MKAIITVARRVTYSSIVEMSEEEFARFDSALNGSRVEAKAAERELNRKIDTSDWQDDELERLEQFGRHGATP